MTWLETAVKKLLEVKWYTWAILALLIALSVALILNGRRNRGWTSRRMAAAAMCIAIAFVLSNIRLFRMPQGGSITPISVLPLIAFALACGPAQGALVGCAYGILQIIQDPSFVHPVQILLDYPMAFGALALGGFAAFLPIPKRFKLPVAVVLGTLGRYVIAVLSGVVFFAEYTPAGQHFLLYSMSYNLSYLGPDAALCALFAFIPGIAQLTDLIRGNTGMSAR